MKTIPVLLPDDLHKQFRMKLYEEDRTAKEFFLSAVELYVKGKKTDPIEKIEEPENPGSAIEVHTLDPPAATKIEDKKSKEKIKNVKKKPKGAGENNGGTKEGIEQKGSPGVSGEGGKGKPGDPPGRRRRKGIWPWTRG